MDLPKPSPAGRDALDLKIMDALQEDGRISIAELAKRVGLSQSPCWRRVKRLEEEGAIRGYRAVFSQQSLGLGLTAFVRVSADRQDARVLEALEAAFVAMPQVVACYLVGGDYDILLHVVERDLAGYSEFVLKSLSPLPGVRQIQSVFVLKEAKPFVRFPIGERLPAPSPAAPERPRRKGATRRRGRT